jgi:hypothetical protein
MPYQCTLEPAFLRIVLFGFVSGADLQGLAGAVEQIERSLAVTPNRLVELSQVVDRDLNYAHIRALTERRKARMFANPVKAALVAPKPVSVGFARMDQILNDHPQTQIEIFPIPEAAEAWLLGI